MNTGFAESLVPQRTLRWSGRLDRSQYDQTLVLSEDERAALRVLFEGLRRKDVDREPWKTRLHRLLAPILDCLRLTGAKGPRRSTAVGILLREMSARDISFWGWTEQDWEVVLRPAMSSKLRTQGCRFDARIHVMSVGMLLHRISDPRRFGTFDAAALAKKVFGESNIESAAKCVTETLKQWGFSHGLNGSRQIYTLCEVLLVNGSPLLEDLTIDVLEEILSAEMVPRRRWCLERLSRVLFSLGAIERPLAHGFVRARGGKRVDLTAGVSPGWVALAERWRQTSTLTRRTRKEVYYVLLKVGRWLNEQHPAEASPELWTRETAARCVAAICRLTAGEWRERGYVATRSYETLSPKTVHGHLYAVRVFFRDCQEWGWLEPRFDPNRYLRTPVSVRRLIGADPRIVADDNWAKLVWAGLNLTEPDLPSTEHGCFLYPFQMLKALTMVWLFAGLRCDEIQRLRVGSIRWKNVDSAQSDKGVKQTCLLHVPVNKTSTAFVKPIDALVGREIENWEKVRPEQPPMRDEKTGEVVHFLFLYRSHRVSNRYLNRTLIPALCKKAGVPIRDNRGRITSHRARATIASQLYNAREPLSLFELQQWLGHRRPESTQSYAKISPTKLARSYDAAGYFERNLRTIEVLVDQAAVRNGLTNGVPWKYYDLGHGYCTYDFFDQCPHRMACAKCSFYQPKDGTAAFLLEGKNNLLRMRQEIPLGESEIAALEDGVSALDSLLNRLANVPTPAGPTPRQLRDNGLVQIEQPASDD